MGGTIPLSKAEADEARAMVAKGKSISDVAEWLGCDPSQVRGAVAKLQRRERTSVGLRDILFDEIWRLRNGESSPQEAQAISSLSKQILSVSKLEMDYARQKGGGQCATIEPLQLGSTAADAEGPVTDHSSATTEDTKGSET